ncbi:MAG: hypothetical protein F4107_06305 [Gemmatimonadetes bacterium]|nr:hypothetical protein [Gemmatimonadota bacterium]MYD13620.1 hypothetical protein [Gemmatimonadota bacterium]MYI65536.1 hypothetical protein [Gemmatimonadota bacterium]
MRGLLTDGNGEFVLSDGRARAWANSRYLGQPELPPGVEGMWIRSITDSAIYATDDDELDVDYVVRLDIVRPPVPG